MKGVVTENISDSVGLKIRTQMNTSADSDTGEKLYKRDVIYGTVLGNWFAFQYYYDASNEMRKVTMPGTRYVAIANPNNLTTIYVTVTNDVDPGPGPDPEPEPPAELPTFDIIVGGANYNIVSVTQTDEHRVIVVIRPIE